METVVADDTRVLIDNVLGLAPTNDITVDVTDIVTDWVNGVESNTGFSLHYDDNVYQGVGLSNAKLVVTTDSGVTAVPELNVMILFTLSGLIFSVHRRRA